MQQHSQPQSQEAHHPQIPLSPQDASLEVESLDNSVMIAEPQVSTVTQNPQTTEQEA